MKRIFPCLLIFALLLMLSAPSAAAADEAPAPGVLCVAYRGDTALYPANSLAGITAAAEAGAPLISADVSKTKDGDFVLLKDAPLSSQCGAPDGTPADLTLNALKPLHLLNADGTESDQTVLPLAAALDALPETSALILDGAWAYKEDLAHWAKEQKIQDRLILRTDDGAKDIAAFCNAYPGGPRVIGVYTGNVIFSAGSYLSALTGCGAFAVQYQSKNYFNVAYETLLPNRFLKHTDAPVMASMTDPDRCGQRSDDLRGWDAMLLKGYTVIETGDPAGFMAYLAQRDAARSRLTKQLLDAERVDRFALEATSEKNFSNALTAAKNAEADPYAALSTLQSAGAALRTATASLTFDGETSGLKGSLRITAGKIIVIAVFGTLLLLGEGYLVHMRKKKNSK